MTKSEKAEVIRTLKFGITLGSDYMARSLSALYRSARTAKSQNEILALGMAYNLVTLPEWIV
jgi:hypothetical protein